MAKVIQKRLKAGKSSQIAAKRSKRADGEWVTFRVIDADSPTFFNDLTHAFSSNVAKARRANTSIALQMGYSDVHSLLSDKLSGRTTRAIAQPYKKNGKVGGTAKPKRKVSLKKQVGR